MTIRKIILHSEARLEIIAAYDYIELQRSGYGEAFTEELENAFTQLRQYPLSSPKVYKQMREYYLHRFHYMIIYEINNTHIEIFHIIHTSRHPKLRYRKK